VVRYCTHNSNLKERQADIDLVNDIKDDLTPTEFSGFLSEPYTQKDYQQIALESTRLEQYMISNCTKPLIKDIDSIEDQDYKQRVTNFIETMTEQKADDWGDYTKSVIATYQRLNLNIIAKHILRADRVSIKSEFSSESLPQIFQNILQYIQTQPDIHYVSKSQTNKEENLNRKTNLLSAIEKLRDQENLKAQDDLKILADQLQLELWGNLDRSNILQQDDKIRKRSFLELIQTHEKDHPEDILGIIILNFLKDYKELPEFIKFHRQKLQNTHKLNHLGLLFNSLGKYDQAIDCFSQAIKDYKPNHPDIAKIFNNLSLAYNLKGEHNLAELIKKYNINIPQLPEKLKTLLPRIATKDPSLTNLDLSSFKDPSLTNLDLSSFRLDELDPNILLALFEAIGDNPNLRVLDLGGNFLGFGLVPRSFFFLFYHLVVKYWIDLSYPIIPIVIGRLIFLGHL